MEFPASYVLALGADRHRMNSARLDAPTEAPAAQRRPIRAALRWIATLSTRKAGPAGPAGPARRARRASTANVACGA